MSPESSPEIGSFRDRHGQVFYQGGEVLRGLSSEALANWKHLASKQFYKDCSGSGKIIPTQLVDPIPEDVSRQWAGLLKHERISFVSYPYEWCFSMLKDAALLQLELTEAALKEGMTLKDASSFNVQWRGVNPVFIDIPSFEVWRQEPWVGYRQFCQLFLYPLLLQAYKNVDFHPWLRGDLDGMDPVEFSALLSFRDRLRPGVFSHVYLQSKLQAKYAGRQGDTRREIKRAGFSKELILNNVRGLHRTVEKLSWKQSVSTWSDYAEDNSYNEEDAARKAAFVRDAVEAAKPELVWDLGSNTGNFSRIAAQTARYVVAMDADHLAVERLYHRFKKEKVCNVLPLVNNLANPSPNLGWRGMERKSLTARNRPDFVLSLALIHHLVITNNVPVSEVVDWFSEIGGTLVIELVTKQDPMVKTLLQNKDDQYDDYEKGYFEACLERKYQVKKVLELCSGTRFLYLAVPR